MPVEIQELIVRATVYDQSKKNHPQDTQIEGRANTVDNEYVIRESVKKVLDILQKQYQR